MKLMITLLFFLLTGCILTHSELSLSYATMGLELWFDKMIPTLLPFMILSGIMVRMNLTEGFTLFVQPIIKPVFRVSKNVCYCMLMGFLCGFPMGAKTVQDLYSQQLISKREAEYLLAFCNNIGPVYFCGFVLPLLHRKLLAPYLIGMYGLPLLYGLLLRYTKFRDLEEAFTASAYHTNTGSTSCGLYFAKGTQNSMSEKKATPQITLATLLTATDASIKSALQSILNLGGYMILFNLFNLVPHLLLGEAPFFLAPLFEISGGLRLLKDSLPIYTLLLLPFGGFSCIAQTYSCIRETPLSIADYTYHKLALTAITACYYLGWFLLSSSSFMC